MATQRTNGCGRGFESCSTAERLAAAAPGPNADRFCR